ncbi:MAG: alpha/beta hydrolase, partial [Oscillospiraceae bacterium]|nr:alpha/beta hydrolase [Oscillospiraceae bacterium]
AINIAAEYNRMVTRSENMAYTKKRGRFPSSDKHHKCEYYIAVPKGKPLGIVQIVHGMNEYAERYSPFAEYLTERGYIVCAHDHLGHGRTAGPHSELGYFGSKHGWMYLINDMVMFSRIIRKKYPELPLFLYGHSMGSLIVRAAMVKYGGVYDGVVVEGTVGFLNTLPALGMLAADAQSAVMGVDHHSEWMQHILNSAGNIGIKDKMSDHDWVSHDIRVINEFTSEERMNFAFTSSAFSDLFMLVIYSSRRQWFYSADRSVPVLILGGTKDPVSSYGKAELDLYKRMCKAGFRDVQLSIYEDARHEMLNDLNSAKVMEDTYLWIDRHRIAKDETDVCKSKQYGAVRA